MTRMKLTDDSVSTIVPPVGKHDAMYVDYEVAGFYVRVFPSGKKSWYCRYTVDGVQHRKMIGSFPEISETWARASAKRILAGLRPKKTEASDEMRPGDAFL